MNHSHDPARQRLLHRLDQIGQSLASSGQGLALIGLGSSGLDTDRMDQYSDLDFFAIVQPGTKERFLSNLGWLASAAPIAFQFQNTPDGYKVLYEDGIFAEFAVFEPDELAGIPFSAGRLVWKAPGVPDTIRLPGRPIPIPDEKTQEFLLGEILTNLLVGLSRLARGEKLAAQRLIQLHAVDRCLELTAPDCAKSVTADPFAPERRIESHCPEIAPLLPGFCQGYERSRESAQAILTFLEERFEINPALRARLAELSDSRVN